MHGEWQLQQAKNGLSQLIRLARSDGPQFVTLHGKPTAVVLSVEDYARLTKRQEGALSAALLDPEIAGEDIDFGRDRDTGRDLAL
ncbi:Prevent-host-death family protein [Thiocapsa sp. KS1]|nr:type II toxin-antitoxin system Phd/YefM family antitoxin [Thiocapsa sp. KS1]CRI66570.1 Prevent-host-death family protein [Thiocapsa sp. KS1]